MAAAYHVWQILKEQQAARLTQPSGTTVVNEEEEAAEKTRARLQSMAQDEVRPNTGCHLSLLSCTPFNKLNLLFHVYYYIGIQDF